MKWNQAFLCKIVWKIHFEKIVLDLFFPACTQTAMALCSIWISQEDWWIGAPFSISKQHSVCFIWQHWCFLILFWKFSETSAIALGGVFGVSVFFWCFWCFWCVSDQVSWPDWGIKVDNSEEACLAKTCPKKSQRLVRESKPTPHVCIHRCAFNLFAARPSTADCFVSNPVLSKLTWW